MNKKVTDDTKSVAQQVREILLKKPFLMDAIEKEIVNYSALARSIKKEIEDGSIEAIKAAIIRERKEVIKESKHREKEIVDLLEESKIELQDKIATLISEETLDVPYLVSTHLTDRHVYVVDQTEVDLEGFKNVKVNKDLVALILISPERIEEIPGVVAFVSKLLSSHGINIKEFISSYTDTIIVLDEGDALEAFSLL